MSAQRDTDGGQPRWVARPAVALFLRAVAVVLPIAGGIGAAVALARILPEPGSLGGLVGWWAAVLAVSGASVFLLERAGRRLLPLAALYRMTLVFPDRMPSRYKIARQAGRVRDLQDRVREAREHGLDDDPTQQAETVLALITGLGDHDSRTRGHSERVRVFADMLAEELDLSDEDRERFRWAALLHDIGKLTVPEPILNKPGRPDEEEWARLQAHPREGGRLLEPLRGWMGDWVGASVDHHERWDGSGYPNGLSGDEISLGGRVVAVCDAFEVMTAARPYKEPSTVEEAREELAACAGTHFDPDVVRAFLNLSVGRLKLRVGLLAWFAQLRLVRTAMALRRPVAVGVACLLALMGLSARNVAIPSPTTQQAAFALDAEEGAVAFGDGSSGRRPPTGGSDDPSPTASVEPSPTEGSTAPTDAASDGTSSATTDGDTSDRTSTEVATIDEATVASSPSPVETTSSPTPTTSSPTDSTSSEPSTSTSPSPSPVNGDPVAADDRYVVHQDSSANSLDVLANDSDPDGDALTITSQGAAQHGTVTCSSSACSYTPTSGFYGSDSFSYTVEDGWGGADSATVSITVNALPVTKDDSERTASGDPLVFNVLENDYDPDGASVTMKSYTQPDNGAVSCDLTTGDCKWDHESDGRTTFTYTIVDADGATAKATVYLEKYTIG